MVDPIGRAQPLVETLFFDHWSGEMRRLKFLPGLINLRPSRGSRLLPAHLNSYPAPNPRFVFLESPSNGPAREVAQFFLLRISVSRSALNVNGLPVAPIVRWWLLVEIGFADPNDRNASQDWPNEFEKDRRAGYNRKNCFSEFRELLRRDQRHAECDSRLWK